MIFDGELAVDCVIGIDPGKSGGIAVYTKADGMARVVKMPTSAEDLGELLDYYKENYHPIVFLEKLSIRKEDAATPGKIFGIQKLMANFEQLKTVLELAGIPYCMVHPLSWEHKLGLRIKGRKEKKNERKKRYAVYAGELYPGIRATLWNGDALLIMHFGRVQLANDMNWVLSNLPERERGKLFSGQNGAF